MKLAKILFGVIACCCIVVTCGLALLTHWHGLGGFAAARASSALHRQVAIGSLRLSVYPHLDIDLGDVRVANAAWGSEPDLARIGRLRARINLRPLLHGVVEYQDLTVDDAEIFLEHDPKGKGNWKFDGMQAAAADAGGLALVPANDRQFPTLIAAVLRNGVFRMRTSSGAMIKITGDRVTVAAANAAAPAALDFAGSYNGVKLRLTAATRSFDDLRAGTPWPVKIEAGDGDNRLVFDGTIDRLLDFDGVKGALSLALPQAGRMTPMLGLHGAAIPALKLDAALDKQGDRWAFRNLDGTVSGDAFSGSIVLNEGGRGQADALELHAAFGDLDLGRYARLLPGGSPGQGWRPDPKPSMTVEAAIAARSIVYRSVRASQAELAVAVLPNVVRLDSARFRMAGGHIAGKASLKAAGADGRLDATFAVTQADIGSLARVMGATPPPLAGRFTFQGHLTMTGKDFSNALTGVDGRLALTGESGALQRHWIDLASLDARTLFHADREEVPYCCLTARIELRHGLAIVQAAGVSTPLTDFTGGGTLDFADRRLDLTISHHDKHAAADLPLAVHIVGTFDHPAAGLTR